MSYLLAGIFGGSSGMSGMIIMGLVVLVVLVFIIVSSVTGKKARKKEQEKRKRVVRDEIKRYLAQVNNQKNITVEFEKVFARKGLDYRYRDVFDVIVRIISPKDGSVIETKAYEVEGITSKVSKKEYKTEWIVNKESDLLETQKQIAIAEKKVKLSKVERAELRRVDREKTKELKMREKQEYNDKRQVEKAKRQDKSTLSIHEKKREMLEKATKYVPTRSK